MEAGAVGPVGEPLVVDPQERGHAGVDLLVVAAAEQHQVGASPRQRPALRAICSVVTPKTRLLGMAVVVVVMGLGLVFLGAATGGGMGTVIVVLGAATAVLGVTLVFATRATYGPSRRLPEHLRQQAPPPAPHTLVLNDDRRVTAIAVFRGGYVRPRRTDHAFDARDVVSITASTAEDLEAERVRQQEGDP